MISSGVLAFGWLALFAVLHQHLELGQMAICFVTLCLSEVLSTLMISGVPGKTTGVLVNWQENLERLLARWISFCVLGLGGLLLGALSLFDKQPILLLACVGLALCLGLLKLATACRENVLKGAAMPMHLRWFALAIVVQGLFSFFDIGVDSIVLLAIVITLSIGILQTRGLLTALPQGHGGAKVDHMAGVLSFAPALTRYIDLIVVSVFLVPEHALLYVCGRGAAIAIELSLVHLTNRAEQGVKMAYLSKSQMTFVTAAARMNLGVLLVGGGVSLGVLSTATYFGRVFGSGAGEFRDILIWAVIAQAAPALFGAAEMMLNVSRHRREVAMVFCVSSVVFCMATILNQPDTGVRFAQHYAALQVAVSAVLAGILAWRCGIWPGLTALFFRQIRLF